MYSLGSHDETIDHLETLYKTKSLKDEELYNRVPDKLTAAGKKINLLSGMWITQIGRSSKRNL
ncbi:MAG: hypothetical protein IPM85_05085 [Chitinophagaceae bacterium]|nr:hypothetical protein [Chitinophagaceae bacterium]